VGRVAPPGRLSGIGNENANAFVLMKKPSQNHWHLGLHLLAFRFLFLS
jgi:hypothetical protein